MLESSLGGEPSHQPPPKVSARNVTLLHSRCKGVRDVQWIPKAYSMINNLTSKRPLWKRLFVIHIGFVQQRSEGSMDKSLAHQKPSMRLRCFPLPPIIDHHLQHITVMIPSRRQENIRQRLALNAFLRMVSPRDQSIVTVICIV